MSLVTLDCSDQCAPCRQNEIYVSFLSNIFIFFADNKRVCECSLRITLHLSTGKCEDTEANVKDYFY